MDPQRWGEIRSLFDELVELDPAERAVRLHAVGQSDIELLRSLEALLAADAEVSELLGSLPSPLDFIPLAAQAAARDPFGLSGRTISHFQIHEPLGAGGMGVVYRAEDVQLRRSVALKFLLPQYHLDPMAKERFLQEARSVAALDHVNLCSVHEVAEAEDGRLFLAMPLYPGETLRSKLTRDGALPIDEALDVTRQIARGLEYAHRAGIVHRDLKPGNLMILPDGTVKILDFGLAKALDLSLTDTGARIGTLAYMAPEQMRGDEVTPRSDLWALGVVLYEMICGKRPFNGAFGLPGPSGAPEELVPPAELWPAVTPVLNSVTMRLLRADPAERYASATAVLEALDGREAPAAPPPRRLLRGRRMDLIPATLALLALLVIGGMQIARFVGATGAAESPSGDGRTELAVLYFDDLSADSSLAYLANALTEGLIDELSEVSALEVVSRNGVKPYRALPVSSDSVARALGVGRVVEGSVNRSGDVFRVTVRLVDGATGQQLESGFVQRPFGDLFELQDDVVREVGAALRATLGREVRLGEVRRGTSSAEAYELVLRGVADREDAEAIWKTDLDGARRLLTTADSSLARAQRLDPRWSRVSVERGWVGRDLSHMSGPLPGQYDTFWMTRALAHAERAVNLDTADASAYELRGFLRGRSAQTLEGEARRTRMGAAEADLRKAVDLDPGRAMAWLSLSELQVQLARPSEARRSAENAFDADAFLEVPVDVLYNLFNSAAQVGPLDEAVRWCDEGRRRFPHEDDFILCQLAIVASFPSVQPDVRRATTLADSLVRVAAPGSREVYDDFGKMWVAQVAARAGLAERAAAYITAARGDTAVDWLAYNEAHARLLLGERTTAVDLLARHLSTGMLPDTAMLAQDWWFEGLRGDPGFRRIMGRHWRAPTP